VINGNQHADARGILKYNNDFNASEVKRVYFIENKDTQFKRGWQGHRIEQRWFSAVSGIFEIQLINIDDWENPSSMLKPYVFQLSCDTMDVLHVPSGYVSCIQALEDHSKLLVMADYRIGEIKDEFRYPLEQFSCTKE